jgi:hypothetical protein
MGPEATSFAPPVADLLKFQSGVPSAAYALEAWAQRRSLPQMADLLKATIGHPGPPPSRLEAWARAECCRR